MKYLLFIIIINLFNTSFGQDRWSKIYHDEINSPRLNFTVSYDKGYLLAGRVQPNFPRYNWLIKTDINGEVLWEKTIGEGINTIICEGIGINHEGDIYLSGSTIIVDGFYSDPFVMKLNACGEKEWCWVFPTPGHGDYGRNLSITNDGGVAFILEVTNEDLINDRVCLTRFTSSGEFLWKKCYNIDDTVAMGNEMPYSVINTPDEGFLITGTVQYSNPEDSLSYLCPYYIKTDSLGNMEWYTVAGFHPNDVDGEAWTTVLSPDSNYYYSSIRHKYWDTEIGRTPAILKMDMLGNIINVYDLVSPQDIGILFDAKFINNTVLMGNMSSGSIYNSDPSAVLFDTLGNVIDQEVLLQTDWMAATEVTYDGKLLYFIKDLDENEEFDAYLFKLNQQLESDTLYTQWYNYDSLCPYQIVSDTIEPTDCGLIVGNKEIKAENEEDVFKVFPNPAKDYFVIENLFPQSNQKIVVSITDMQFREIERIEINSHETETRISTINYGAGVYLIRFYVYSQLKQSEIISIIK